MKLGTQKIRIWDVKLTKKSHTAEKLFDRKCATKKIGTPAKIGTQNEDIFFGGFGFKAVKNTGWLSKILLVRIFSIF